MDAEAVMSYEETLGLLIGLGVLLAVIGYLTDLYFHPERFRWLELPQECAMERPPSATVWRISGMGRKS